MAHRILENTAIRLIAPAAALSSGVVPAAYVDVSFYNRFVFLVLGGTTDATAFGAKVVQATSATGAGKKDVTGATITNTLMAGDNDNKWAGIEVENARLDINNGYAFVGVELTITGGSSTMGSVLFLGGWPRELPIEFGPDNAEVVYVDG